MRYYIGLTFIFLFTTFLNGQNKTGIPIHTWRAHSPYRDGKQLFEVRNKIFVSTQDGLYSIDKRDLSIKGYSKVDGFQDIFIQRIGYDADKDLLAIVYEDGGIDFLQGNRIFSNNDFKSSPIADKKVNNISFYGNKMFLSAKSGTLEYRLDKNEFGDRYEFIGENGAAISANSTVILNNSIYIGSDNGVEIGDLKDSSLLQYYAKWKFISKTKCNYLEDFNNRVWGIFNDTMIRYRLDTSWINYKITSYPIRSLKVSNGKLIVTTSNEFIIINGDLTSVIFNTKQNDGLISSDGVRWIALNVYGAIRYSGTDENYLKPNGPGDITAFSFTNQKEDVWVAPGGLEPSGTPLFNFSGFYQYSGDWWYNHNMFTIKNWFPLKDIYQIAIDTVTKHQWISSIDSGVIEFKNDTILNFFNSKNSALSLPSPSFEGNRTKTYAMAAGMAFDKFNNLWIVNYRTDSQLVVKKADGTWKRFRLNNKKNYTDLVIDDSNHVWVYGAKETGISVLNYGVNIDDRSDDRVVDLSTGTGNGGLPTDKINVLVKDLQGSIWVGSNDGVAVFPDPSLVFTPYRHDAQKIWVKNGKESGYLLTAHAVNAIAIDGGNRKWFGTRDGVWLTNKDGDKILDHFNAANSPMPSDIVQGLIVNGKSGELFIATDRGMVSYRTGATAGDEDQKDVYAFPNPVRPGYHGPIAIKGLAADVNVKITDISGNLVYETTAIGGTAEWDGKDFSGREANSGVYMVLCTNSDGTKTKVTKILIVR